MEENIYSDSKLYVDKVESPEAPAVIPDSGTVAVLAFPGTEEKMRRAWEKMCPGADIVVISDPGSLSAALEEAMASDKVSRRFVLAPANLVPTHEAAPLGMRPRDLREGQARRVPSVDARRR